MRNVTLALAGLLLAAGAAAPEAVAAPALQGKVPACVTPEALMQLVAERNQSLDPRFKDIAKLYQQHGEELGLRWDYAFFQMLLETGHLTFKGSARNGLKPTQHNFASIGATGNGNTGERFSDVATGVQAHLQHIRLYAGDPVAQPAARRTKQVESHVLAWSRGLGRRATYADLAQRWAPNDTGYGEAIEQIAQGFKASHCKDGSFDVAAAEEADEERAGYSRKAKSQKPRTRERDQERVAGKDGRSSKRRQAEESEASSARTADEEAKPSRTTKEGGREPAREAAAQAAQGGQVASQGGGEPHKPAGLGAGALAATAGAGGKPPLDGPPKGSDNANCKVWTASFGGNKSVLIRVTEGGITHFTALEVHAGREQEETKAYIAAYARGGKIVGEPFSSPEQAINKAFELCPKT